jgi:hypothetical protein
MKAKRITTIVFTEEREKVLNKIRASLIPIPSAQTVINTLIDCLDDEIICSYVKEKYNETK